MKSVFALFACLFIFSINSLIAQSRHLGWCHLLPNAKTKLLVNHVNPDRNVYYNTDEVLLLFDVKGQKGYAVDVDGRIVEIQDTATIKKIDTIGRVVKIVKAINISLDKKLNRENNVWLIGFSSAANTAKILLSSGEIVEIPKDCYIDLREYFINQSKKYVVQDVSN